MMTNPTSGRRHINPPRLRWCSSASGSASGWCILNCARESKMEISVYTALNSGGFLMKGCKRPGLLILRFSLTVLPPLALAQGKRPSGSFGFQLNTWVGPDGPEPIAIIGVLNFDGAGKVTGSFTQVFAQQSSGQITAPGTVTGTYSSDPDGTGTMNLAATIGPVTGQVLNFDGTFAMVIT